MKELISAVDRALGLLGGSHDSPWATQEVAEIKSLLRKILSELEEKQRLGSVDKNRLKSLFLPTGSLQEISIANGWADEYLEISEIVDRHAP